MRRCFAIAVAVVTVSMLPSPVSAQSAVELYDKAFTAYEQKNYRECGRLFGLAFTAGGEDAGAYFQAACCLALGGDKDGAFRRLHEALDRGLGPLEAVATESEIATLRADRRWRGVQAKVDAVRARRDEPLRAELLKMEQDDQDVRKYGDFQNDKQLGVRLSAMSQIHVARLKEIIEKHGWPGSGLVASDGAHAAWLLVQHADGDPEFQARCLELIEAAASRREASRIDAAFLTDRVLVNHGKKQRYGLVGKYEADGRIHPQPIEDEANVDERRRKIGLEPLAEYYRRMNSFYDSLTRPDPH